MMWLHPAFAGEAQEAVAASATANGVQMRKRIHDLGRLLVVGASSTTLLARVLRVVDAEAQPSKVYVACKMLFAYCWLVTLNAASVAHVSAPIVNMPGTCCNALVRWAESKV